MTAPHIVDPATVLGEALTDASPDLMRGLLQTMINALLSDPSVARLMEEGTLIRTDAGEIALPPERVKAEIALDLVRRQLEAVTRFMNDTLRDGVVVAS